jgi:hypothetical protein
MAGGCAQARAPPRSTGSIIGLEAAGSMRQPAGEGGCPQQRTTYSE